MFVYFVSIGAGLSFGLTIGVIPALLIWKWNTGRGNTDAWKATKGRTRP